MDFGDGIGELKQALSTLLPASKTQAATRTETTDAVGKSVIDDKTQADATSLSSAGALIAKVFDSSDVRTAKVEALQQAIASGSYNVPSSMVADKIIQSLTD